MSKPEDISQEAWDASIKALWTDAMHDGECPGWMETQVALVARAILAAKAEERQAILEIVETAPLTNRSSEPTASNKIMADWIAAAIRKRGEG